MKATSDKDIEKYILALEYLETLTAILQDVEVHDSNVHDNYTIIAFSVLRTEFTLLCCIILNHTCLSFVFAGNHYKQTMHRI